MGALRDRMETDMKLHDFDRRPNRSTCTACAS